jgi:hypothetical protein
MNIPKKQMGGLAIIPTVVSSTVVNLCIGSSK